MYQRLTYIGPISMGLIYGVMIALFFLIFGLIGLVIGPAAFMPPEMTQAEGFDPGMVMGGGIVGVLIGTVIGFVMGFIMGVIGALIFNIVASITGGLKMGFRDMRGDDI